MSLESSNQNRAFKIRRPLPFDALSKDILQHFERAFTENNTSELRTLCKTYVKKISQSHAQVSNVSNSIRFPLGEINGSSIGIHVYRSWNGNEPVHSHAQDLQTFVIHGSFTDEVFDFSPDPSGAVLKYRIAKKFSKNGYELWFQEVGRYAVLNSYRREIKEEQLGFLRANEAHMVRSQCGTITLFRFSGQFSDSNTFISDIFPLWATTNREIEASTMAVEEGRDILAKHLG